jgi:hypothetical protein
MSSENNKTQGVSVFSAIFQIVIGVGAAIFFVLQLLARAWQSPDGVNALQIGVSVIFIILSGFLSLIWGDKFVAALGKLLGTGTNGL